MCMFWAVCHCGPCAMIIVGMVAVLGSRLIPKHKLAPSGKPTHFRLGLILMLKMQPGFVT